MEDIRARIEREVSSWEGVGVHPHRFGGVEFRLGKRELGHLHESWADLPFTTRIREMLIETGRAEPHRFGVTGWVSHDLDDEVDRALQARLRAGARRGGAEEPAHDVNQVPESGE